MRIVHLGFDPDFVDYEWAWERQREVHAKVVSGQEPDTVLLLEHQPVYTAGKRTESHERPNDGTPVVDVDRGGKITWHGPGQITGYPIVRLPAPIDVVAYVRALEEMMIRVCADFGVTAGRVDGQSGTWVLADPADPFRRPNRKVGAIGIRVSRQVAMHGFASHPRDAACCASRPATPRPPSSASPSGFVRRPRWGPSTPRSTRW
jgi:lipoyl(octanoyl) transferase